MVCSCFKLVNITATSLKQSVANLKRDLRIDKKNTLLARSKKTSAEDNRPSAKAIGGIGVLVLCVSLGTIVLSDAKTLYNSVKSIKFVRKYGKRRKKRNDNTEKTQMNPSEDKCSISDSATNLIKNDSMSANDLLHHICTLEEDVEQKIQKLRHTQNPRHLTPQHSTPKEQPRNLTDSGIVQTRRTDFGDVKDRRFQTQLQQDDDAPTLFGLNASEHEQGARSKQLLYKTTSAAPRTSSGGSEEISSILRYNGRNARQVVNNQEKVHTPGKNTRRETKLVNYDGSGEWVDFKSHFEACAIINSWDEYEQGLYLAAALRGHAQSVFSDLPTDKKMNYETLVKSSEERFAPSNQTELYKVQLKETRLRASDTLPELGQTIRRLVNRAYPLAPNEVKETLAN
ncbi:Hypothetical predicted protein [Mytilus galloprovincialis]|uniref:Uncharacterized protein n=1 Tax=Mytilus galloprovincialis TaxID=29158 RepID=A0A8B6H0K0_MYTGA|nr:Hypothetical predicted protein [Mytilus galloprovincialis]